MTQDSISTQIRRRRLDLGLTLARIARRAGTSVATLSRYESGWPHFETHTLRKLATALDCDLHVEFRPVPQPGRQSAAAVTQVLMRLFWDRKLKPSDLSRHREWVVARVLDYGNLTDVNILRDFLGRGAFAKAAGACLSRLSPRARSLWSQLLQEEGYPCTKKSFRSVR